eukprot:6541230-Prymnesium_polylepis.1
MHRNSAGSTSSTKMRKTARTAVPTNFEYIKSYVHESLSLSIVFGCVQRNHVGRRATAARSGAFPAAAM